MRDYPFHVSPITEVDGADRALLKQLVADHRPFVAKGLVTSWPLFQQLERTSSGPDRIELFKALLGDADIRFTYLPAEQKGDIGIGPDLKPNFQMDSMTSSAGEFLNLVERLVRQPTGECAYAAALPLGELPLVSSQLGSLDGYAGDEPRQNNLWIGSGDHVVDLHFDLMRNLISMVDGRKRITLFPPEALPFIYPAPLHRPVAGVTRSLVKLLDLDETKYPRFRSALALSQVAIVEPGDTLYIPPLWWHHVESYGFNVMINAWYEDLPRDSYKAANRMFNRNLARFSELDMATLQWLSGLYRSAGFEGRPIDDLLKDRSSAGRSLKRRQEITDSVAALQASLVGLPDYWKRYFGVLYEYYVFRQHGDPYPTLPGMLRDLARSIRPGVWGRLRRRVSGLLATGARR